MDNFIISKEQLTFILKSLREVRAKYSYEPINILSNLKSLNSTVEDKAECEDN